METRVYKGHDGWQAETEIELERFKEGGAECTRVLSIRTSKSRGLSTRATVYKRVKRDGYVMQQHEVFRDLSQTIAHKVCSRVTEKAVTEAHEEALQNVDDMVAKVKRAYNI